MNLPTTFALEDSDVDKLRAIAGELMRANPLYRKLLRDLGATWYGGFSAVMLR